MAAMRLSPLQGLKHKGAVILKLEIVQYMHFWIGVGSEDQNTKHIFVIFNLCSVYVIVACQKYAKGLFLVNIFAGNMSTRV
jgi:hypothetical protein